MHAVLLEGEVERYSNSPTFVYRKKSSSFVFTMETYSTCITNVGE
jgi:hypothetical protein